VILANLDCEAEWSGTPLPAPVLTRLSALGTLLRVLDPDVHLLGPVDPVRIPDISPGTVYQGVTRRDLLVRDTPAWGATARLPASGSVEVARACNDRRLAAVFGDRDDAVVVESVATLEAMLPAIVGASATGGWVAKATICAAGRDRVRRTGAAIDDATRIRLQRLMARSGALVLEPWRDRVLDLGQPGIVEDDGAVTLVAPHRLHVDPGGGFAGVTIGPDPEVEPHAEPLALAARAVGDAIARRGHRGPFVVDAFVHRDRGGHRLRAVVEINARLTFGWIARAWASQLGDGTLMLGRGAPPVGATALLLPGGADDTSAWFSASRR